MLNGIRFLLAYTCNFECHLCFLTRKAVTEEYPEALAPKQVYGLD